MSNIKWTDETWTKTWNPLTGCTKVSAGCDNCYEERIADRFWGDRKFSQVEFHRDRLEQPLKWRKPRKVSVSSMSDLFHEQATDEQLDQVFAVMALTPQHTYQVLTKRPDRMLEYCKRLTTRSGRIKLAAAIVHTGAEFGAQTDRYYEIIQALRTQEGDRYYEIIQALRTQEGDCLPLENVWLGVSVENQKAANERIPLLLQTPAALRFLSCEPLLGKISFRWASWLDYRLPLKATGVANHLDGLRLIDWVIVGGEFGPGARPCDITWIRSILEQCKAANVPCFVKRLGSKPQGLFVSKGEKVGFSGKAANPDEWPHYLQVREFPE